MRHYPLVLLVERSTSTGYGRSLFNRGLAGAGLLHTQAVAVLEQATARVTRSMAPSEIGALRKSRIEEQAGQVILRTFL
jgi:hypothetical protein